MNSQMDAVNTQLLQNLTYNPNHHLYILQDPSFARILTLHNIGTKPSFPPPPAPLSPSSCSPSSSSPPSSSFSSSSSPPPCPNWTLHPQQLIYLLSCKDMPISLITTCYSKMTPHQINCTYFYLWMRIKSRLLRCLGGGLYDVFDSVKGYTTGNKIYTVRVIGCQDQISDVLDDIGVGVDKIAVVGDSDCVVFDVCL